MTRPAVPATGGRAVLTSARIAQLDQTVRTVRGVAQIRDDGDEFLRTWTRAAEQLASTRWRAAPTAWNTLSGRVTAAARQTTTAVKVSASTINFLADSGRLQITVTNDLAVPVEDVKLTVEASNPRLRIDSQPPILRIGPKSRATVSVRVTALAAGSVPLRTTLTTPDGTVIGQGADVQVRVTPTGNWIYWGLAAVGGLILVLGIVRTVRRRPAPGVPAVDRDRSPERHPRMTDVTLRRAQPRPVQRGDGRRHRRLADAGVAQSLMLARSWASPWPPTPSTSPTRCPTPSTCCWPVGCSTRCWSPRSPRPPTTTTAATSSSTGCSRCRWS